MLRDTNFWIGAAVGAVVAHMIWSRRVAPKAQ